MIVQVSDSHSSLLGLSNLLCLGLAHRLSDTDSYEEDDEGSQDNRDNNCLRVFVTVDVDHFRIFFSHDNSSLGGISVNWIFLDLNGHTLVTFDGHNGCTFEGVLSSDIVGRVVGVLEGGWSVSGVITSAIGMDEFSLNKFLLVDLFTYQQHLVDTFIVLLFLLDQNTIDVLVIRHNNDWLIVPSNHRVFPSSVTFSSVNFDDVNFVHRTGECSVAVDNHR